MKKLTSLLLVATMAMTLLVGCGGGEATEPDGAQGLSGVVEVNGSTSMEAVMGILGEVFMEENPDVIINYSGTGSGTGVETAMNDTADIGLASRSLKDSELEDGAVENICALDGVAVIVNPANPVTDLTMEQIAGISSGKITNWSEVGGEDLEISFNGREAGSGTRGAYEEIVGVEDSCVYQNEFSATGDVMGAVSQNPNAIGYVSLSAVNDSVVSVKVNGVECSEANIQSGEYAIQRPFVMITKEGKALSVAAQAFLDFAMSADSGAYMVEAGAVAAN